MPPNKNVMTVVIDDNYKLIVDDLNLALMRRGVIQEGARKGEETWSRLGYYSSPDAALWALVERETIQDATLASIEEFTKVYLEIAARYERPLVVGRIQASLDKLRGARQERRAGAKSEAKTEAPAEPPKRKARIKPKPKPKMKPKRVPAR